MDRLRAYLDELLPKTQPAFRPTAIQGLLQPRPEAEIKTPESFVRSGFLGENNIGRQLGLLGLGFAPGAGFSDYAGTFPSAQGGVEPGFQQNIQQGNYLTAGLQGLGALGDAATLSAAALGPFAPLAAGVGMTAKAPRAVQRGVKGLIDAATPAPTSVMSEFVPNVERGSEMFVQHSLQPNSILFAEQFGGLPAPSLAVSKRSSDPLQQYGSISLIGPPEMAVPSAKNPVYAFDAYTKRNPKIYTPVKPEFQKEIQADLLQGLGKFSEDRSAISLAEDTMKNLRGNLDTELGRIQFLRDTNQLPDPNKFEKFSDFNRAAREKLVELQSTDPNIYQKQEDWANKKFLEIQNKGATEDKIYKGRTPSGKKKYVPATMESIVKETIGQAGDESLHATLGAIRAKISPKFTNSKQVKEARERIVSTEDFKSARDTINEQEQQILYDLGDVAESLGVKLNIDGLADLRQDIITGQLGKWDYSKPFVGKIPQNVLDKIQDFKTNLAALPTEYFEIKPKRGVALSEFSGAIVPQETSQAVLDSLRRQGITNIQFYKNLEERKKLIDKFGDKMFSVGAGAAGLGTAGLLATEEELF
jgi:hypothetical protein